MTTRPIMAIDPGTRQSGVAWLASDGKSVMASSVLDNENVLKLIASNAESGLCRVAIEMVASYGMAVGKEVFRTVWWTGRFADRWFLLTRRMPLEIFRKEVKLHLCQTPRAKDANIRQALIDKLGPPGKKAEPGPTYGVKSHAWAALGVAVTAAETRLAA